MNRRYFAVSLACAGLGVPLGCNSIVGNDDGFVLSLDADGGGSAAPGVDPGSAAQAQDRSDAASDPDAATSTPPEGDPSATDAGATGSDVDAGMTTAADASTGASKDAGSAACPGMQVRCGLLCVDPQSDPLHCGNCSTVCSAPPMCKDGKCKHGN